MKKAQISIFIILGIVIVVFVGIFSIIQFSSSKNVLNENIEFTSHNPLTTQEALDQCIETNLNELLSQVALQGGHIVNTSNSDSLFVIKYIDKGNKSIPELSAIESNIEITFEAVFEVCVESTFQRTNHSYYDVSSNPKILIDKDHIFLNPNYYLTYEIEDTIYETESDFMILPHPLGEMYDIASKITERFYEEPEYIDYAYLNTFNVDVYIEPISESIQMYQLRKGIGSDEILFSFILEFT